MWSSYLAPVKIIRLSDARPREHVDSGYGGGRHIGIGGRPQPYFGKSARWDLCHGSSPPGERSTGSSWSYSRENGPLRSNTSTSSSHHAKMWGVDHAIFGIIRNAMSCSITRWNVTIFWRDDFVSYHFKSKSCFFINIYFHQTQSDRANHYHWTLPPLENIVPYFICFAFIIKAKEAFFNKTDQIISYNMYTVAMDTTTKPF